MRYSSRTEIAIVQERPVRAAGARDQADRNARRFGLFVRLSLLLRKPTPLPNNLVWRSPWALWPWVKNRWGTIRWRSSLARVIATFAEYRPQVLA